MWGMKGFWILTESGAVCVLHTDNSVSTYLTFWNCIWTKLFVEIWNHCGEQITGCSVTLVLRTLKVKTRFFVKKNKGGCGVCFVLHSTMDCEDGVCIFFRSNDSDETMIKKHRVMPFFSLSVSCWDSSEINYVAFCWQIWMTVDLDARRLLPTDQLNSCHSCYVLVTAVNVFGDVLDIPHRLQKKKTGNRNYGVYFIVFITFLTNYHGHWKLRLVSCVVFYVPSLPRKWWRDCSVFLHNHKTTKEFFFSAR
jgi:hypothetical protein